MLFIHNSELFIYLWMKFKVLSFLNDKNDNFFKQNFFSAERKARDMFEIIIFF